MGTVTKTTEMAMIQVANIKKGESYDLYIGRANRHLNLPESKWRNPFPLKKEALRLECLSACLAYALHRPDLILDLPDLDGKTLGCYCKPKLCHGQIWIGLRALQKKDQLEIPPPPWGMGKVVRVKVPLDGNPDYALIKTLVESSSWPEHLISHLSGETTS